MYIQNPEQFIKENPIDNLNLEKAKKIYDKLVENLNHFNYLYYVQSQPVISDYEYDLLFHYLENLEKKFSNLIRKDSPTQRLTNQIQSDFKKVKHKYPLLSLENTYDADEVEEKLDKIIKEIEKGMSGYQDLIGLQDGNNGELIIDNGRYNNHSKIVSGSDVNFLDSETSSEGQSPKITKNLPISFYIEPKYDGLSIELIYENGFLIQGITRGNGIIGEDVTENVKTINTVPLKIPYKDRLHVRGEVVVRKSIFEKINKEREKQGLDTFSNPRNLASGSLRQLDVSITRSRQLDMVVYEILNFKDTGVKSHHKSLDFLEKQGFWIFDFKTIGDLEIKGDFGDKKNKYLSHPKLVSGSSVDFGDSEINSAGQNHKESFLNHLLSYFKERHGLKKEEILEIVKSEEIKNILDKQDVDFDGLVVKVDNDKYWDILGQTSHHPKRAFAYKYPAKQISTQILDVELSVGRTGVITPVAILEPVDFSGVTVSRASLQNFDFIKEKDIKIGDYVWVQRAGEVIPYISGVIKERRLEDGVIKGDFGDKNKCENLIKKYLEKVRKIENDYNYGYLEYSLKYDLCKKNIIDYGYLVKIIEVPYCPVCGGETLHLEGEVALKCINVSCPAQVEEKIAYFAGKNGLDIEGMGIKIISSLLQAKLIADYGDIFYLEEKKQELLALPLFKEKKVNNLLTAIEKKREIPLNIFLAALGIELLGKKTSKLIVDQLQIQKIKDFKIGENEINFYDLMHFLVSKEGEEFLLGIKGVGPKVIQSIKKFFHEEHNQKVIIKLLKKVKILILDDKNKKFSGKQFVITGSIEGIPRDKIENFIEENGGDFSNQVTKETTLLLVGNKPGHTKLQKAQEYNIPRYDLYKFLEENGFNFPEKVKIQEGLF